MNMFIVLIQTLKGEITFNGYLPAESATDALQRLNGLERVLAIKLPASMAGEVYLGSNQLGHWFACPAGKDISTGDLDLRGLRGQPAEPPQP